MPINECQTNVTLIHVRNTVDTNNFKKFHINYEYFGYIGNCHPSGYVTDADLPQLLT
jgi:hypothetical protein